MDPFTEEIQKKKLMLLKEYEVWKLLAFRLKFLLISSKDQSSSEEETLQKKKKRENPTGRNRRRKASEAGGTGPGMSSRYEGCNVPLSF